LAAGTDLRRVVVEVRPLPGAVDAAPGRGWRWCGERWRRWGWRAGEGGGEGRQGRQGRPTRGRERRPSYLPPNTPMKPRRAHPGSNRRPIDLQSIALPLSYGPFDDPSVRGGLHERKQRFGDIFGSVVVDFQAVHCFLGALRGPLLQPCGNLVFILACNLFHDSM
jgi:hypothetical protein